MTEFINYYFDNWGVFIQVIITLFALIFAFFAWKGLRKEESDRQKQIANLEKIANHLIISRRNNIKPELKYESSYNVSSNPKTVKYKFINNGKKAFGIFYLLTNRNEKEFTLASSAPHGFDLEQNKCVDITIEYLVDEITKLIEITFTYLNEDYEIYHQKAFIYKNSNVSMGYPILELQTNKK